MGFFKKLKRRVSKVVSHPLRSIPAAIATGGISLVSGKVERTVSKITAPLYNPRLAAGAVGFAFGGPIGGSLGLQAFNAAPQGGSPMGFNLGNFLGGLGQAATNLGNFSSNPYLQTVGAVTSSFGSGLAAPQNFGPVYSPMNSGAQAMTVSNQLPSTRAGSLTQEIFNAGLMVLSRLGIPAPASMAGFSTTLRRALSAVASLARRTPAGTMVNLLVGLGLGAYEASLLTVWHAQRRRGRRMNPANSKALHRAARRIKSFHKLCVHTDVLKSRGRRSTGKCGTCRKSPCKC
jgi:hypothetical protein